MLTYEFAITDVRPDPSAAVPTLVFRLRIAVSDDARVQSILLRTQVRIEPELRHYDDDEQARLYDLFGHPAQWSHTLKPFLLCHLTTGVSSFDGSCEIDLHVPVSYDLEVTAGSYLHSVRSGSIPLIFLFSGTVFLRGDNGVQINQIPWDCDARFAMPSEIWTSLMDAFFPDSGWVRLSRETIDALRVIKSVGAIPTWDGVMRALLQSQPQHEDVVG